MTSAPLLEVQIIIVLSFCCVMESHILRGYNARSVRVNDFRSLTYLTTKVYPVCLKIGTRWEYTQRCGLRIQGKWSMGALQKNRSTGKYFYFEGLLSTLMSTSRQWRSTQTGPWIPSRFYQTRFQSSFFGFHVSDIVTMEKGNLCGDSSTICAHHSHYPTLLLPGL